ncbi:hypothetical protein, partial [Streptomyces sundarbansensis]
SKYIFFFFFVFQKATLNLSVNPRLPLDVTNRLLPLIITKRNHSETILKTQSQGNKGNLRASTYKECTSKYLGRSKGDYASHRRQQQNNANSSLRQGLPSIEKQRPVWLVFLFLFYTFSFLVAELDRVWQIVAK